MGCDGGSIPRRDEMVKLKKKAEKADKESELAAKWKHCALSEEELKKPIVSCELGKLYNKEALLLALLDKPNLPEVAQHIRSLRDVVELSLTSNPAYKPVSRAMDEATQCAEFVCPISGLEMSGRHRFVYFRRCGCVMSEKTIKEVPSETCHKCGRGYSKVDVVVLNGSEDEVKRQMESMIERREDAKHAKMAAKRKRKNTGSVVAATSNQSSATSSEERDSPPAEKKSKISVDKDFPTSSSSLLPPNGTTVSGANGKTVSGANGKSGNKTRKAASLPIGASKYSRQNGGEQLATSGDNSSSTLGLGSAASTIVRKATSELSSSFQPAGVDPKARDAYKALFHSADTERPKDQRSHWVTFFPYH